MSIVCGLLALACAGAEGPSDSGAKAHFDVRVVDKSGSIGIARTAVEPEQISYEVRVVDTPADWRDDFYKACKRVGREGRSTIWTVDDRTVRDLVALSQGSPRGNVIQSPKVTAMGGGSAIIDTRRPRAFVVDVDRAGEDQFGKGVPFRPSVEEIMDGLVVQVAGRRTAGGVRAHLKVESTWVGHVARAKRTEVVDVKPSGPASVGADYDLPQVVEAKVDGDYEIPDGHQALVSLGTVTTVDGRSRPVVMERLLVVAARPIVTEAEERAATIRPASDRAIRPVSFDVPAPMNAPTQRRMPPVPSRSLLTGFGPDGREVELPPLPDAYLGPDSALVGPPSPQPSPQAPADRAASRPDSGRPDAKSALVLDGAVLASGRTQLIRIPLGGRIAIEVKAKVVPADQPE